MTDYQQLVVTRCLHQLRSVDSGIAAKILFELAESGLPEPLTSGEEIEVLNLMTDKGWIRSSRNPITDNVVHYLTPAGRIALQELERNV